MFFFRRSKVVVDCFINLPPVYELFKIDHAHRFVPQGWKSLPLYNEMKPNTNPASKITIPVSTIKRCVGLTNLFTTGFILPSWTDVNIEMMADGRFNIYDPMNVQKADPHPDWMWWSELYKGYSHLKLYSPWLIREKSGINFSWQQCDWHNTERLSNFHVLSGVIDYKAQHNTHVNVFMKKNSSVKIQAGEPLAQMIPLTDKDVELRNHLIDDTEYNKIANSFTSKFMWFGQHRALLSAKKESKCPFGFKKKM